MHQAGLGATVTLPVSQIFVEAGRFAIDLNEVKHARRELLVVEERLAQVEKKLGIKPEDAR